MNRNVLSNAAYVYKQAYFYNAKYILRLVCSILLKLLIPVFATFIPTVVVYLLINEYGLIDFSLIVGGVVLGFAVMNYFNSYLSHILFFDKVFIRMNAFFELLSHRAMETGYENIEYEANRAKLMKATGAIEVNRVGVELLLQFFPIFVTSIAGIILYSTYIITIDFTIVLVLLGMAIMNWLLNSYARNYEIKTQDTMNKYRTKLKYYQDEANKLSNAKDIRIYKLEKWFYTGIKMFTKKFSHTVMNQKFRYSLASFSDSAFSVVRDLIAYTLLVTMVIKGTINVAEFTFMIGIVIGFAVWLNRLSESYGKLREASVRIDGFRDYMDIDDGIKMDNGEDVDSLLTTKLSIEFNNVTFTYPNSDKPVIKNLNLTIKPGEKIALVGENGAGKTTLIKMLAGLYTPTDGEIRVNGTLLEDFNRYDYYRLIGVIFQDVNILPFTIAENVSTLDDEHMDLNRVHDVLDKAGLKDKIESLDRKEQTRLTQIVDDKGIMLSGGEMQKLMLARLLYKDSPILILDEPTAALDPLAEHDLYMKYNSLTENKTSIFISHRLASTQFCDRILYMQNGAIIEMGTHKVLMDKKGKYAEMFNIQSQYYKDDVEEEPKNEI